MNLAMMFRHNDPPRFGLGGLGYRPVNFRDMVGGTSMPAKGNFKIKGGMVGGAPKARIRKLGVMNESGIEVMTPIEELENIRRILPMQEPIPENQRLLTFNTTALPSFIDHIADSVDIELVPTERLQIIQNINTDNPAVRGKYKLSRNDILESISDNREAHIITNIINTEGLSDKPIEQYQDVCRNVIDFIKDGIIEELSSTDNINFSPEEIDTIDLHISAGSSIGNRMQIRKLIGIIRRAKEQHIRKQKEQKITDERNRNRRNAQIASIKPRSPSPVRSISPSLTRKKKRVIKIAPVQAAPIQAAPVQATPPDESTYDHIPSPEQLKAFPRGLEWENRVNGDYGKMWVYKNDVDKYKKLPDTSLTNSDTLTIYDMNIKQVNLSDGKGGYKYLNDTVVIDILGNCTAIELKDYHESFELTKNEGFGIHFAKSKLIGNKSFIPYFTKVNGEWKLYGIWYTGRYYSSTQKNVIERTNGWISPHKNLDYYAFIRMKDAGQYNAYSYNITNDLDSWNPIESKRKGENNETLYIIKSTNVPDEFYEADGIATLDICGNATVKDDVGEFYIPTDKMHIIKYD